MSIINLKNLSISIFFLASTLWSGAKCMDAPINDRLKSTERIEGRFYNEGHGESYKWEHIGWSPMNFNRFEGSIKSPLVINYLTTAGAPIDVSEVIIPEDGDYFLNARYYVETPRGASNIVLSIDGKENGFTTLPMGQTNVSQLSKYVYLKAGNKISVRLNIGNPPNVIKNGFDLTIRKTS